MQSRQTLYNKQLQQALHEANTSANHLDDLYPILQDIPLDKIKNFIGQHIDELDQYSSKNIYFNSLSLEQIFHDDILQYILSFAGMYHTKPVNKKWKNLSDKNENLYMKKIYSQVNEKIMKSSFKYDKSINNKWVIHPRRPKLHQIEIDLGFQMLSIVDLSTAEKNKQFNDGLALHLGFEKGDIISFSDSDLIGDNKLHIDKKKNIDNSNELNRTCRYIQQTIDNSESGDVIVIHDGTYKNDDDEDSDQIDIINKDIYITGTGGQVTIQDLYCYTFCSLTGGHVYFDNINWNFSNSLCESFFTLWPNAKLWINDCRFKFMTIDGILVRKNACLNVTNSEFIGGTSAINISPVAKEVNILNSIFRNCGIEDGRFSSEEGGCILVSDVKYCDINIQNMNKRYTFVQLKCIGNIFEDNECFTIAERHEPVDPHVFRIRNDEFIINTERCVLKDNMLKGYNGRKVKGNIQINDANKMYYNDVPTKGSDMQ
eukprot:28661_1